MVNVFSDAQNSYTSTMAKQYQSTKIPKESV